MSRVSVDAGAYRLAVNIMLRAADRHGEPTIADAAHELRATATVIDMTARDELLEALELAIDTDGGTTYNSEDDEVGERSCCGEVSYKPHHHDCWVVKARAAIAKAKGETI